MTGEAFKEVKVLLGSCVSPNKPEEYQTAIGAALPETYTWHDIAVEDNLPYIFPVIPSALTLPGRLQSQGPAEDERNQEIVQDRIASAILPTNLIRPESVDEDRQDDHDSDSNVTTDPHSRDAAYNDPKLSARPSVISGLKAYAAIVKHQDGGLSQNTLLTLTAFTNPLHDSWTTAEVASIANTILEQEVLASNKQDVRQTLLTETIPNHLRLRFQDRRQRPSGYSGRLDDGENDAGFTAYTLTILEWAVHHFSDSIPLSKHWNLYVPATLSRTLLRNYNTPPTHTRTLWLIHSIIKTLSPAVLSKTGLTTTLIDELTGQLKSSLPTFPETPANLSRTASSSMAVQKPAFWALLRVIEKWPQGDPRTYRISTIMRSHIIGPFHVIQKHVELADLVVTMASKFVSILGVESIEHLEGLLDQIYTPILHDPFKSSSPSLLLNTIRGIQVLMRNSWPQLGPRHNQILELLVLCWTDIITWEDMSQQTTDEIKQELVKSVGILHACPSPKGLARLNPTENIKRLVGENPSLEGLFKGVRV